MQRFTVNYNVDGSTCQLLLNIFPSNGQLTLAIDDDICPGVKFGFAIHHADHDLLKLCMGEFPRAMKVVKATKTKDPWGCVTKTNVLFYGSGRKGGLLVTEQKIKKGDMYPYKVTVAHYYAASSGNIFLENKIDVGVSMVLNIQRSSDEYDITVDGPSVHPSSALFYMFQQVCETGIWKPMACPHCASQRQISRGKFLQSESEDSDGPPPPARLPGPVQNAASVLANDGAVRGNNNGNLIVRTLIYGGKH